MKLALGRQASLICGLLFLAIACSGASSRVESGQASTAQAVSTTPGDFVNVSATYVQGAAIAIGAGPAVPWVIGTDHQPYHYAGATTARHWQHVALSTSASRIATAPDGIPPADGSPCTGTPWLIDVAGHVWRSQDNATWNPLPNPDPKGLNCAADIGVANGNNAWAVGCDDDGTTGGTIFMWNEAPRTWTSFAPNRAHRIAVTPEGPVWTIDDQHNVYHGTSTGLTKIPGAAAIAIGAGPNNTAWIISPPTGFNVDGQPAYWNGSAFVAASFTLGKEISVGSDGTPWMVASSNAIFRWGAPWVSLGPNNGFSPADNPSLRWSGDVEDIDTTDLVNNRVVVGTAGGGVWVLNTSINPSSSGAWTNISDTKFGPGPSPAIASLAQLPGDPFKTVMVATGVTAPGDPSAIAGNGIWKGQGILGAWAWGPATCRFSPNSGTTACPSNFTKIRYNPVNHNIVYASTMTANAVTSTGLFRSVDGGATFVGVQLIHTLDNVTDFDLDPDGIHVYAAVQNVGIEVGIEVLPLDGGLVFEPTPTFPPTLNPATQFGFVKLALAPSNPTTMYLDVVNQNDDFEGVFMGTNMRLNPSWSVTQMTGCVANTDGCAITNDHFLQTQNQHNQAIAVSPFDPNMVIVAGTKVWVTATAGTQGTGSACFCPVDSKHNPAPGTAPIGWTLASSLIHNDIHALTFGLSPLGEFIFAGSDGGIYLETGPTGTNWSNSVNTIPVAQEVAVAVSGDNILADAWDVGAQFSLDHGTTWAGQSSVSADENGALIVSTPGQPTQWLSSMFACPPQAPETPTVSTQCVLTNNGSPQNQWSAVSVGSVPFYFTQPTLDSAQYAGRSPTRMLPMVADDSDGTVFTLGAIEPIGGTWIGVLELIPQGGIQGYGPQLGAMPIWLTKVAVPGNEGNEIIVIAGGFPQDTTLGSPLRMSINAGPWMPIGDYLPQNVVRVVTDRPLNSEVYVLTQTGQVFSKPFSTVAAGDDGQWNNMTGDLTLAGSMSNAVFFNTILADPVHNTVFVGTSEGVYKMTNDCVRTHQSCVWQPWGDGLPVHPASVESTATTTSLQSGSPGTGVNQLVGQVRPDGRYYIYAATWERGIWVRDATADDP